MGHIVKTASRTNDVFVLVLGLLAFLYLTSVTLVLRAEVDAVRVEPPLPASFAHTVYRQGLAAAADRKA